MVKALFDTNVLIDYLSGIKAAKTELAKHSDQAISLITWMEIQVGTEPSDQVRVDKFPLKFEVLPITMEESAEAVAIGKRARIRLPDAIIWATASLEERLLGDQEQKTFSSVWPWHSNTLRNLTGCLFFSHSCVHFGCLLTDGNHQSIWTFAFVFAEPPGE